MKITVGKISGLESFTWGSEKGYFFPIPDLLIKIQQTLQ
jgi:hypothetical protein